MSANCSECATSESVIVHPTTWRAGGRNCFDLFWTRVEEPLALCEDCEDEGFQVCDTCGDLIDALYYGAGYLPVDYEGDYICPDCYAKLKEKEAASCEKNF